MLLALLVWAVVAPGAALSGPSEFARGRLRASIDALRRLGSYEDAARVAAQLLALTRSDSSAAPAELADAQLRWQTLNWVAQLPSAARSELTRADRLEEEVSRARQAGDLAGAVNLAKQRIDAYRRLIGSVSLDLPLAQEDCANLLLLIGRYVEAEALLWDAVASLRLLLPGDSPALAMSLNAWGRSLQAIGRFSEAEPPLRESLAMGRRLFGDADLRVATGLNNLGMLLQDLGRYRESVVLLDQARDITRREFPDNATLRALYANNRAIAAMFLGELDSAAAGFREALDVRRTSLGPDHAEAMTSAKNLADALIHLHQYAEAESLLNRAIAVWSSMGGAPFENLPKAHMSLGGLSMARHRYAEAMDHYGRALALFVARGGDDHPSAIACLRTLAQLQQAQGQPREALALLERAARAFESARAQVHPGLERATFLESPYDALAAARLSCGDRIGAWSAADLQEGRVLADLLVSASRHPLPPGEMARRDSLRQLLDDLDGRLQTLLQAGPAASGDSSDRNVRDIRLQLEAAQATWSNLQGKIAAKYPDAEGQGYSLQRVQAILPGEAAVLGWLDVSVMPDSVMSWAYVIRHTGPVSWVRLDAEAADAQVRVRLPTELGADDWPALYRLAGATWFGLLDYDFAGPQAARLAGAFSAARIQPVLPLLEGIEDLIVIPSGPMAYIPAETLVGEQGQYLGDRFTISYTSSATIYTWLQEQAIIKGTAHSGSGSPGDHGKILLLGDPPFVLSHKTAMALEKEPVLVAAAAGPTDPAILREARAGDRDAAARLPRLPGTRAEVNAIAALAAAPTLLLGPDASEQDLTHLAQSGDLASYRTIHLATHAFSDPDQPERSCLILSQVDLPDAYEAAVKGERIYDGRLTVQEILREWKLDADLVTLSACETALGKQISGEGVVGFAHAFLQAGARSLLVSLWKVDDTATSLLMTRFYENLWQRKMGKAAALREAKQWLRAYVDDTGQRPYEHPYFWSAFILVGDRD